MIKLKFYVKIHRTDNLAQKTNIQEKILIDINKNLISEKLEIEERLVAPEKQSLIDPDFVRIEKNIAAFGFFTPSSKRVKNTLPKLIKFTQTIDNNRVDAEVKIIGHIELGMPTTADQDKYLAFQKIIERNKYEKGKVENPITFTTAELLKLLGKTDAGVNYKEVQEWLEIMKVTTIKSQGAIWLAGKKRTASDIFSIFDRAKSIGDELDDGTIADKNYVWLSNWYLENLNNYYLIPIDFENYKLLKNNISKALIPLLQIWLYASREVGRFEKRYSEICQTLNITEYKHLSLIKQKFSPSLEELVKHQYLESWAIEKTSDNREFKIVFYHGFKFYADRARAKRLIKSKTVYVKKDSQIVENRQKSIEAAYQPEKTIKGQKTKGNGVAKDISSSKTETLTIINKEKQNEMIKRLFVDFGISFEKGTELVSNHFEEAEKQIKVYRFRNIQPNNKAGYLIDAIEKAYSLPDAYLEHIKKQAEAKAKEELEEITKTESESFELEQEKMISDCRFCNEKGHRQIKHPQDPTYKAFHLCTHIEKEESLLVEF